MVDIWFDAAVGPIFFAAPAKLLAVCCWGSKPGEDELFKLKNGILLPQRLINSPEQKINRKNENPAKKI